jgi:hypothetical protein
MSHPLPGPGDLELRLRRRFKAGVFIVLISAGIVLLGTLIYKAQQPISDGYGHQQGDPSGAGWSTTDP